MTDADAQERSARKENSMACRDFHLLTGGFDHSNPIADDGLQRLLDAFAQVTGLFTSPTTITSSCQEIKNALRRTGKLSHQELGSLLHWRS